MPARTAMTMRCTVERVEKTERVSAGGQPIVTETPQTVATDMPCYAWAISERFITADARVMTVAVHKMLAPNWLEPDPLGRDLQEGDRVLNIRDKRGNVIVPNRLLITSVIRREDHSELTLEEAS